LDPNPGHLRNLRNLRFLVPQRVGAQGGRAVAALG
jgi:hypothetical protein